ncbi:rust resistance kinase Lr10-like [Arachis duranensis]|uniref:Rust resistance kinase Lr10-like n=1 Tax=Arachis duranensis TaxID=130453 RepID=A0A9C6WUN2_ARADU|nr:rust resistance kinase Lr10-like [Arachis duranensis]
MKKFVILSSVSRNKISPLACLPQTTMPALLLLLLVSLNLSIGICYHDGDGDDDDDPVGCPVRVYCSENNANILELPGSSSSVKLPIRHINYTSKTLEIYDPKHCFPELSLRLDYSSFHPFRYIKHFLDFDSYDDSLEPTNCTFFDCSSGVPANILIGGFYDVEDLLFCPIYNSFDEDDVVEANLVFCTKLARHVLPISVCSNQTRWPPLYFGWSTNTFESGCFLACNKSNKGTQLYKSIFLPLTGAALLFSTLGALYYIYCYYRNKGEDHQRVQTFLKDYEALNPTRFSYADIKRITKQFKDKLGEGAHGAVYKGKLSNQILVAVKILNNTDGDGKEFINEVGTIAKIHHVNVVRLLGYCADGSHRALVYHFFPNGNLQTFIAPSSDKESFLGWNKLHQIALGIAKGIEYLHQGCDQRILHFDINPYNVLLDDGFTPKISDFGLAKLCSKNRSTVSMTAARGTLGYMAPEVFSRNFGNVSYKSDIYSYGMLLLEMVGGRKNTNASQETFQVLYPNWIHNLLEGDDTYIPIDDDGDFRIAKKLAIVGVWCIQWHPVQRPSMKSVVQMLEGEESKLKVPPNPFESAAATTSSAIIPARRLNLELEVIPETDTTRNTVISHGKNHG